MPGKGILRIDVPDENTVPADDLKLALLLLGAGVHLGPEDPAVLRGLDGLQNSYVLAVAGNLHLELVYLGRQVHVVVRHFDDDSLAGVDPHQFLLHFLNLSTRGADELIADGTDLCVEVSSGQGLGKEAVSRPTPPELVDVTSHHLVPRGNLENVVFRHCENVRLGRNEQFFTRLDFDLIDRKRLPDVFLEDELDVTNMGLGNREGPVGPLLGCTDPVFFLVLLFLLQAGEVEVRGPEGAGRDLLEVRILPGSRGLGTGLVVGDVGHDGQFVDARLQKNVD